MVQIFHNVLSNTIIDSILSLSEVLLAKQQIDQQSKGHISFQIPLTSQLQDILQNTFHLDLSNVSSIPMRWIKGDTYPHIDRGTNSFDNTYLLTLLIVSVNSYLIKHLMKSNKDLLIFLKKDFIMQPKILDLNHVFF
jgi:hypothetical protein